MKLLTIVLSTTLSFPAYSQVPSQASQMVSAPNTVSKPDNRGTETLPLVIKVTPSEDAEIRASEDKKERQEKARSDRALVDITLVLAVIGIFQLVVFAVQARRLRETVEVTRKSANEMAKQVRVSIRSSGPFLLARGYKFNLYPPNPIERRGLHRPKVGIGFENLGQSPGIVRRMGVKLILTERDTLPPTPPRLEEIDAVVRTDVIGPGKIAGERVWQFSEDINAEQDRRLRLNDSDFLRFYALGYVVYEDVFGGRVTHRFCLKVRQNGFEAMRGPAEYNRVTYEAEPQGDPQGVAADTAPTA